MQNIDTLAAILRSQSNDNKKIMALHDFYTNNSDLSKVRIFWEKNQYEKSLHYTLSFLRSNQKKLLLKYIPIATNREFVTLVGKKALDSNHATIKTIGQLIDIQKENIYPNNKKFLVNLSKTYDIYKLPLLCVNRTTNAKEKCEAIIHEIHAWLLSGCTLSPTPLKAFFYEWRTSIFSISLLRQMDKIFFFEI